MRAASTRERTLRAIERARDLMAEGRFEEAEAKLERIRERTPEEPALYLALGELAAAYDESEEAIEHFREAAERDPDWPEPLIAMGWEELEREAPERALELGAEIRERWPDDPDVLAEALMLIAVARIDLEQPEDARAALSRLEALAPEDPQLLHDLAAAWCDAGDHEAEERVYRLLIARDPDDADALHALGACLHAKGAREEATELWLRVREMDLARERPPHALSPETLERIAEDTLRELPRRVRDLLANVPILVEDAPSEALVREGVDPRLLGLFTGTPLPAKSHLEGQPTAPDAAFLYLRNLEAEFDDPEELEEQVRITILHETAHFFGLDEEELEELGLG